VLTAALVHFTGVVLTLHFIGVVDQVVAVWAVERVAVYRLADCRRAESNIISREWRNPLRCY